MMSSMEKFRNSPVLSNKHYKARVIIYGLLVFLLVIFCVSLYFLWLKNNSHSSTLRQTTYGPVEGIEETTVLGQQYYAFRGIPYAAPPITGIDPYSGEKVDRRFKAPEPLNYSWTETRKAHNFGQLCQTTDILPEKFDKFNFSEDCLFLNIFVPAGGAQLKTVVVYIHGAGHDGGTTADVLSGPDFLLSQDNVVVHIEYRVQMFGFLNLGFGEYTGNMGLKDQQLGLKWVYENIKNFSGKRDEITIFGGSVGGTFVHAHTLNEESRKYFTRALCSSGAISVWNIFPFSHLTRIQKCLETNRTGSELADYMRVANSRTLSKCQNHDWLLSIESPNNTGAFITKRPKEIYTSDKAPVIDIMFITASQEAIQFFPMITTWNESLFENHWFGTKPVLPFYNFTNVTYPREYNQALNVLKESYFSNTTTTTKIEDIWRINIDFKSDHVMRDNILNTVMYQANANNNSTDEKRRKNTFLLKYSTHALRDFAKAAASYTGATHSDDLFYIFYCRYINVTLFYESHLRSKDNAYDLIMWWVKMITNFARFGDPSIEGDTPFKSCKSADEIYCQEVANEPKSRLITNIKEQFHYDAWREIDAIYNRLKTKWPSFY